MPSYAPVKQKTEEESENDEALLSETSTEIVESDGYASDSTWNQGRWRLRHWRLTEIGLVLLIVVSNLLWFLSSQIWVQPTLKDPNYCECAVTRPTFSKLIIIPP
jgi:hypothetical protein